MDEINQNKLLQGSSEMADLLKELTDICLKYHNENGLSDIQIEYTVKYLLKYLQYTNDKNIDEAIRNELL